MAKRVPIEHQPSPELRRLVAFWVKVLRLSEWDLELRIATEEELDEEEANALVNFQSCEKCAEISLRRFSNIDEELEHDLLHELLHLVFLQESVRISGHDFADQVPFEFGLNTVAHVLVNLRRAFLTGKRIRPGEPAKRGRKKRV